jgi:hypothetical protein
MLADESACLGNRNHTSANQYESATEIAQLEWPVSQLNLSIRGRRCLANLGIETIGQLVRFSPDKLLDEPNFGVASLDEIHRQLAKLNLRFQCTNAKDLPNEQLPLLIHMRAANADTTLIYPDSSAVVREARLLASEPWANEVAICDPRIAETRLFSTEQPR